jgi:hypothetical protein
MICPLFFACPRRRTAQCRFSGLQSIGDFDPYELVCGLRLTLNGSVPDCSYAQMSIVHLIANDLLNVCCAYPTFLYGPLQSYISSPTPATNIVQEVAFSYFLLHTSG